MYNLNELVEEVNRKLLTQGGSNIVNDRLVRHYTTEKLVPPALKNGRVAQYTEDHVDAIIALRLAQSGGLTTTALKNLHKSVAYTSSNAELCLADKSVTPQNEALSFLRSLETDTTRASKLSAHSFTASMPEMMSVASGVSGKVYSSSMLTEHKWTSVHIRDGLELHVKDEQIKTLTPVDLKIIEQAFHQLKNKEISNVK